MNNKVRRPRTRSTVVGQPTLVRSGKNMLMFKKVYIPTKEGQAEKKEKAKAKKHDDTWAAIQAELKSLNQ